MILVWKCLRVHSFEAQKHIEEPLMKQSLWNVWSSTEFWLLTYAVPEA